jgi:hypothetical protein
MVLVSVLSLKMTNSDAKSLILCDDKTEKSLKDRRHQVLQITDTIRIVQTPDGSPTFRNRWIKSQLGLLIDQPFVYIDGDTLVRGKLDFSIVSTQFAAVANHNARLLHDQIWAEDHEHLIRMNWPQDFPCYFNGGVFYVNPDPATREFFVTWHRLWLEGVTQTERLRDQPSFNTALLQSTCSPIELPFHYNQQILKCEAPLKEGLVWHFYSSELISFTVLGTLVETAKKRPRQLRAAVLRAIRRDSLWPNLDLVSELLIRWGNPARMSHPKRQWLMNERRTALKSMVRTVCSRIKRSLWSSSNV